MGQSPFGRASMFGFKNLLRIFHSLPACSVLPPTWLSIRSVPTTLPYSIKKTRYLSSTYNPHSPHTLRLIIGRSVSRNGVWSALAPPLFFATRSDLLQNCPLRINCCAHHRGIGLTSFAQRMAEWRAVGGPLSGLGVVPPLCWIS
jgi:hypothetical protein